MLEKLQGITARLHELERALCAPETAADPKRFAALMREAKQLRPIADAYNAYQKAEADRDAARELLAEGGADREMRDMATEELHAAEERLEQLDRELRVLLLPRDPND